ncbi:uncharacterized protein LOC143806927 isoform X2 [Ranitomeya variabilis]|uniref:uncharacterized protein LOC143806927 isoform X2 n=1 Tax=Ranitomeya variabilis TaxID=490064 RepID=UPI0040578266
MREKIIAKPWSKQETDLFFLAISMVGTDFTTISQMFRHRQRVEIKNKFKKEERVNAWRLDQAFRERKHFDLDVFAKHLEKAHEEQKKTEDSINQPHNTKPSKKQKGDFAITKNAEADDPHVCCSCIDGEDDLSSQSPALTCEEESSLLLFTEESDYQSGLDLAGAESSSASQDECGKLSITPALLARGHFQRLKPNLKKATSRKGASEDKEVSSAPSTGNADGDTGVDFPGDDHSGKEENMKIPESGSSQYSCKSAIHSHSPSLTQDSTVSQDLLTEVTSISETQDIKSAIKPAPLPPGRVQTPKPYLAGRPERKAEIYVKESKNFEASVCNAEKRPATDQINSSGAENVPGNEAGAASLLAKNNEKSSVTGEDSLTLKKSDDDATPGTSVESTPAITNKEKNASDQKRHTLKPVVTRRRLQRPKPNLSKSVTRSAVTAPPVSAVRGDSVGSNISVDAQMLTDPESKSSAILDTCDGAAVTALAHTNVEKSASIQPAQLRRGRLIRPVPNLVKPSTKTLSPLNNKKNEDLNTAAADKEENMKIPESGSSQYACMSEIHSHSPTLTQDSTVSQDLLTEGRSIFETQDIKSAIKPAPLTPGWLQTPKPYLAGRPERKTEIDVKESKNFEASVCNAEKRPATDQINSSGAENVPGNEAGAASLLAKNNEKSSVTGEDSLTLKKSDDDATPGTSVESTPAITNKEKNASDQKRHTLKPVVTRRRLQRPKPNLSKSVTRSAVTAPPMSVVQGDSVGSSISVEAEMLTDPESKSSEILDTYDGAAVTALAQPKEFVNDPEKGKVASLKPVYKRFPKPSPNLGRAVRKETSTTELSKTQDLPDTSTAGDVCKEAGHITVEKSASIQPAQLRRGRLIRPVPNLVKPSTKTLSPLNNKKNEDLNTAAADKDIMDLTDDPQSSSQTSSVQDLSSLQRSNVETVSHEFLTVGQEDPDPGLGLTSRKRSAQCMDDGDVPALPKKPSVSEDIMDLTDDPQSSSQTSSVQDLFSLQRSNVETVSHELLTVGQEDPDPGLGLTSRKRSAQCMDDGDLPALPKKPSVSEIPDNQDTDLHSPAKSHDLAAEEEAAPVPEYFFSDIFMEVDDAI